ncbi:MAG: hypothetical protein LBS27_12195 [Bifidobacteriaceae bacterium]|nr:hypothetical protein [Bifidobacteriaceae bacterium]
MTTPQPAQPISWEHSFVSTTGARFRIGGGLLEVISADQAGGSARAYPLRHIVCVKYYWGNGPGWVEIETAAAGADGGTTFRPHFENAQEVYQTLMAALPTA